MTEHEAARIVVLADPAYPQAVGDEIIQAIVGPHRRVTGTELGAALAECDLFVSFHGPYFPQMAWPQVMAYLERGGNLAIFGGSPFAQPVRADGRIEPAQDTYTVELGLGVGQPVEMPTDDVTFAGTEYAAFLDGWQWRVAAEDAGQFWALTPKLTQRNDHPTELGSAGTRDTHLLPLVHCGSAEQTPLAAPFFLMEHSQGRFRGGRWLIAPWRPGDDASWHALRNVVNPMLRLTAEGAQWCEIRPTFACYQPGEQPQLIAAASASVPLSVTLQQSAESQESAWRFSWEPGPIRQEQRVALPIAEKPGLYRQWYTYHGPAGVPLRQQTGYWVWDEAAVARVAEQRLHGGRDLFYQGEVPFFVYGTTYMDREVQRRFLTLPNPARWEADFAVLRAAGINLVRTGLWTAWDEVMPVAGRLTEDVLRALDAFVMVACHHNLQIIFTLFAFSPPLFGGENPWLDPRSVAAQRDFVAVLAQRYAHVALVTWDLINEPSFGAPQQIFAERPIPNGDGYERQAFQQWLRAQHHSLEDVRLRWRLTPTQLPTWQDVVPPEVAHFSTDVRKPERHLMLRAGDFTRFSQTTVRKWAEEMVTAIRAAGGRTLIGIGQDEAGVRPAPQFYAPAVDYTTSHPWWNTGDLLWDLVMDKTLDKPNLAQEVGVMLTRDVDGRPWRTEAENARLLERKLFLALAARSAGVVQWLWHTNALMLSDNENSIGLMRADGSAKPELAVMHEVGACIAAIGADVIEPPLPDVWLVAPYTQWFVRPALAVEATQRAVHALGYGFGVVPQVVSDLAVPQALARHRPPRLIMLPSSQLFDDALWPALRAFVRDGGTLYLSGVVNRDAYALPQRAALSPFMQGITDVPVAQNEILHLLGQSISFAFEGDKSGYVRKAHQYLRVAQEGRGTIIWSGVPVELSNSPHSLRALYAHILGPTWHGNETPDVLVMRRPLAQGEVIVCVSEGTAPRLINLTPTLTVEIAPQRAGAVVLGDDQPTLTFGGVRLITGSRSDARRDAAILANEDGFQPVG